MVYASLEEAWGGHFNTNLEETNSIPKKEKKEKKVRLKKKNKNNFLLEQFENFNSQTNMNSNMPNIYNNKVINEVSQDDDTDDDYDEDLETDNSLNTIDNKKKRVDSNSIIKNTNENLIENNVEPPKNNIKNNSNDDNNVKDQMEILNNKINYILEKLDNPERKNDKSRNDNHEKNIYDLILFIVFGLFIILMFESITKLIVKSDDKFVCIPKIKLPQLSE